MMTLPTWLYSKDGSAEIVRDQETYERRVAEGWKDSPARFTEEALAAEKEAAEKEATKEQSPTVPPPAPVEKKPAPAKKKPAAVANKKDSSADDLI